MEGANYATKHTRRRQPEVAERKSTTASPDLKIVAGRGGGVE